VNPAHSQFLFWTSLSFSSPLFWVFAIFLVFVQHFKKKPASYVAHGNALWFYRAFSITYGALFVKRNLWSGSFHGFLDSSWVEGMMRRKKVNFPPYYQEGLIFDGAFGMIDRALFTIERALFKFYRALFIIDRAFWTFDRALFTLDRALFIFDTALFTVYRALLTVDKALINIYRNLYRWKEPQKAHLHPAICIYTFMYLYVHKYMCIYIYMYIYICAH